MIRWNAFCRNRPSPIAFIYCLTGGAVGSMFVDFGPGFVMRDRDGRNPLVKIITDVYKPTHDSVFENELQERLWQAEKDKKIVRSHQSKKM